jgi:hypothetical protein
LEKLPPKNANLICYDYELDKFVLGTFDQYYGYDSGFIKIPNHKNGEIKEQPYATGLTHWTIFPNHLT